MALSLFKTEQTIIFRITASRIEEQWQERTFVARLLTRGGDELEITANKAGTIAIGPRLEPPPCCRTFSTVVRAGSLRTVESLTTWRCPQCAGEAILCPCLQGSILHRNRQRSLQLFVTL